MIERQRLHPRGGLVGVVAFSVLLSMARICVAHNIGDRSPYNDLYQCVRLTFNDVVLSLRGCARQRQECWHPVTLDQSLFRPGPWASSCPGPMPLIFYAALGGVAMRG